MIFVDDARVTETPNAVMTSFATPSAGSKELSTWRVSMQEGATGPEHVVSQEQVWVTLAGAVEITAGGSAHLVRPGQSAILPAGEVRQVRVVEGPVDALVCMSVGGYVTAPGSQERHPLPWAE